MVSREFVIVISKFVDMITDIEQAEVAPDV